MILLSLMWLAVAAYPILQIVAIARATGRGRWLAALPLLGMGPIYVYTAIALAQKSNLWPMVLMFASPVALLVVAGIMLGTRKATPPGP